jgi:hypothetical protein
VSGEGIIASAGAFARLPSWLAAEGDYRSFLEAKIKSAPALGLPCDLADVATHRRDGQPLRDHQRHIIQWGVQGGRRAFFLDFGLGKSTIQVETARIIMARDTATPLMRKPGLIVGPLGCRSDMIADAAQLGVDLKFVRSTAAGCTSPISRRSAKARSTSPP